MEIEGAKGPTACAESLELDAGLEGWPGPDAPVLLAVRAGGWFD